MKWDYRVENFPIFRSTKEAPEIPLAADIKTNEGPIQAALQKLGSEGWELVGVNTWGGSNQLHGPSGVMLYLKKEVR